MFSLFFILHLTYVDWTIGFHSTSSKFHPEKRQWTPFAVATRLMHERDNTDDFVSRGTSENFIDFPIISIPRHEIARGNYSQVFRAAFSTLIAMTMAICWMGAKCIFCALQWWSFVRSKIPIFMKMLWTAVEQKENENFYLWYIHQPLQQRPLFEPKSKFLISHKTGYYKFLQNKPLNLKF